MIQLEIAETIKKIEEIKSSLKKNDFIFLKQLFLKKNEKLFIYNTHFLESEEKFSQFEIEYILEHKKCVLGKKVDSHQKILNLQKSLKIFDEFREANISAVLLKIFFIKVYKTLSNKKKSFYKNIYFLNLINSIELKCKKNLNFINFAIECSKEIIKNDFQKNIFDDFYLRIILLTLNFILNKNDLIPFIYIKKEKHLNFLFSIEKLKTGDETQFFEILYKSIFVILNDFYKSLE